MLAQNTSVVARVHLFNKSVITLNICYAYVLQCEVSLEQLILLDCAISLILGSVKLVFLVFSLQMSSEAVISSKQVKSMKAHFTQKSIKSFKIICRVHLTTSVRI